MHKTHIVDSDHPDPFDPLYYETTQWHAIGENISWRPYKHWGSGVRAMQGCLRYFHDHSGCISNFGNSINYVTVPCVVEARHYRKEGSAHLISAVFSPPDGIGCTEVYFWEIYNSALMEDPERFFGENAEIEMEHRIQALLKESP